MEHVVAAVGRAGSGFTPARGGDSTKIRAREHIRQDCLVTRKGGCGRRRDLASSRLDGRASYIVRARGTDRFVCSHGAGRAMCAPRRRAVLARDTPRPPKAWMRRTHVIDETPMALQGHRRGDARERSGRVVTLEAGRVREGVVSRDEYPTICSHRLVSWQQLRFAPAIGDQWKSVRHAVAPLEVKAGERVWYENSHPFIVSTYCPACRSKQRPIAISCVEQFCRSSQRAGQSAEETRSGDTVRRNIAFQAQDSGIRPHSLPSLSVAPIAAAQESLRRDLLPILIHFHQRLENSRTG